MGYRVKDIKTAGPQPKSARFPTANEFGTRVLQVEQPALVFFPSLAQ